jgi:arylamine N-acetyltransferase
VEPGVKTPLDDAVRYFAWSIEAVTLHEPEYTGRVDHRAMNDRRTADRFLAHLQLDRAAPSLEYLHRIIREHQLRVPFETLTKLVDYESGRERGDFLPPIEAYVERIVERGAGGLCWTLARGLHFLLTDLGFDAALMYMDPGHCCVRVELPEGAFYADVGYSAPIFQAYPLFESFTIESASERFEYEVRGDAIVVTRNPGPAKTLDPAPRTLESLKPLIDAANDWSVERSFLKILAVSKHVDGVYTSLRDGLLRRFTPTGLEERTLPDEELPGILERLFGIDPALYEQAASVRARYMPGVG